MAASDLAKKLAGRFIVLDGPDGSGKSTQIALLRDHLAAAGADVLCVHDPGATAVGEKIRSILLDPKQTHLSPIAETLLFMASRAQLVAEKVRPALAAGKVVLCDRFISATIAYQGASGVPADLIVRVGELAVGNLWPDLTIILDLPAEVGMARAARRGAGDRVESRAMAYHDEVRENFRALRDGYPAPVVHVDATLDRPNVFANILAELEKAFGR